MRFLSVCSGIEAASVAWEPLGWSAVGFSEIEKFPCEVLAHHYGSNMPGEPLSSNGVPNFGDMTNFERWPDLAIDILVGGTPCQSFSIAGLRKGLADPRGNLMLTYLAIARRYKPRWLVWENVPGVLSSNGGRDFGTFIKGLEECGYHAAWRVLDAQYVRVDGYGSAVPQRRERVFVVGYLGDWRRAAAVLFEREGMQGYPPPRRKEGEGVAPTISARTKGGGGMGTDFECDGGLIASTGNVAHCLNAGGMGRQDFESETLVAQAFKASHFTRGKDAAPSPVAFPLSADADKGDQDTLIAFSSKDYGNDAQSNLSPTLQSMNNANSNPNAGGQVAIAIQERATAENVDSGPQGKGYQEGVAYTLEARNKVQSVAYGECHWAVRRLTPLECERLQGFPHAYTAIQRARKNVIASQDEGYRRYLALTGQAATYDAALFTAEDGPRHKALGNSMAVNVMRWIGRRIEMVSQI